jgi:hypothetical protein
MIQDIIGFFASINARLRDELLDGEIFVAPDKPDLMARRIMYRLAMKEAH